MTTTFKKSAVAFVLAATAMFGVAGSAKAQTPSLTELMQQLAALQAQIAQMQGGSSTTTGGSCTPTAAYTATTTLRPGMSGASVSALQTALNNFGGASLVVDGSYGPATSAAVRAFQTARGLAADGIAGPMTQGALATASMSAATNCPTNPTNPTNPTTPSTLNDGTQGSIETAEVSAADESEVDEAESDVEIYAVDYELDNDGDLIVQSIDVVFNTTTAGVSNEPWDYFESLTLMVDGEEEASMDVDSASDWTELNNDVYRARFTGVNFRMEADETTKVSLAVTTNDVIDGSDDGAVWEVYFGDIRVVDGTGFVTNEDFAGLEDTFTVNASSEEADLDITEGEDNPDATVIEVSESSDTNDVTIFAFDIEEENGVDATIEEMTFTFTATGNENNIIRRAYLYQGNTKVGDESMTANGAVTFDNMNLEIEGDETSEMFVKVDIEDTNNGVRYANGSTIQVTLNSITEAEDANGNDESEMSGDITNINLAGDTHELRSEGVMFEFVSASQTKSFVADDSGEADRGDFRITFRAKAFGADARLDRSCEEGGANAAGQGVEYVISNNTSNSTTCVLTSTTSDSEDTVGNTFELDENQWRTFTLTVEATAGANASAEVSIESFNWGTATDNTNANYYTFNLDDYKTDALILNVIA